jgi:hypothetical protein
MWCPQDSILGPLSFLPYVNDLSNVTPLLFTLIFADDTNVFVHGPNLDNLIKIMGEELAKIIEWMYTNKLSLNIDKTNFIIFVIS